jgi:serine/threonine protein kinase
LIKKQGSGAFSEVYKAQNIKTGAYVAIKCLKSAFSSNDQVKTTLPLGR